MTVDNVKGLPVGLRAGDEAPGDFSIPTVRGSWWRRTLMRRYGLPNAWPTRGERVFGSCRLLFVDDNLDGKPIAYWEPCKGER